MRPCYIIPENREYGTDVFLKEPITMDKIRIRICLGSSCFARGNERNVEILEKFMQERGLRDEVDYSAEGCLCFGRCSEGPIVEINGVCHTRVTEGVMPDLLKNTFPRKS